MQTHTPPPPQENGRPRRVVAVVFGTTAVMVGCVLRFVPVGQLWLWMLAMLPAAIVVLHAIHIAVFKNPRFFEEHQEPDYSTMSPDLVPIVRATHVQERRYYSTPSLLLRFALPAIALTLVGLSVGYALFLPPDWARIPDGTFMYGASIGAIGAYLSVLLFLGGRAVRSDVTAAAAIWAIVTMVVGPLLAGALEVLFTGADSGQFTRQLLPFAAGFSLRFIVDFVDTSIRRVFSPQSESASRRAPLTRLRGMTREIEERLAEEGIADVTTLAWANPHRLRRNTRFDKRQIASWIDEALLMTYFPVGWEALEADGITGAIDLAWYTTATDPCPDASVGELSSGCTANQRLTALATRNKLEPSGLVETVRRLADDAQVRLVWALYQLDDTETADGEGLFHGFVPENAVIPSSAREPSVEAVEGGLEGERQARYQSCKGLFLVHTARRSSTSGQVADILLQVTQHRSGPLTSGSVRKVEYQLGPKFFAAPVEKTDPTDGFSLRVSAWGPFLCVARVTLDDGTALVLERYVDFDMRPARTAR